MPEQPDRLTRNPSPDRKSPDGDGPTTPNIDKPDGDNELLKRLKKIDPDQAKKYRQRSGE